MIRRIKLKNEDGTPRPTSDIAADYMAAKCGAAEQASHPSITHCDNCGLDWLDNGLNPIGCPYCKHAALVARLGELVAEWRLLAGNTVGGHMERMLAGTRNYTANDCADDLARVVAGNGGGDGG